MDAKILIVDSISIMRSTYINALENEGYTNILEAENGEEACRLFTEEEPDLVIMDLSIPGKSGLESLKDIKKNNPDANVIICSAQSHRELVIESVRLGASDFITKPLKTERLMRSVKKLLDK